VTTQHDVTLGWVEDYTTLLLQAVDRLTDDELGARSALPGWSRRQLLAHIGFNAEALRRLLHWAASGDTTPMYASKEQRAAEIAEGAAWEPAQLRQFVQESAASLATDVAELEEPHWRNEVVTAQGRTVPASEIIWLRAREVCIHVVDLHTGLVFADLPLDFCSRLVTEICALRSKRRDGPQLRLVTAEGHPAGATDGAGTQVTVTGDVNSLACWLSGRGPGSLEHGLGQDLPTIPAWI
jgi:maleylpyruvate isomerase